MEKIYRTKSYGTVLIIATILFACFVVGSHVYVTRARGQSEERTLRYLTASTGQLQEALSSHFEGDMQMLRIVSIGLREQEKMDEARLIRLLQEINYTNTFIRMGLAGPDGNTVLVDMDGSVYRYVDLSGEPFFAEALKGQETTSPVMPSLVDGQVVHYIAEPILVNGEVTAVVLGVHRVSALSDILSARVLQGDGFYQLFDADGANTGPEVVGIPEGMAPFSLDMLSVPGSEGLGWYLDAVHSGEYTTLRGSLGGVTQLIIVQPLRYGEYFLVAVVPQDTLDGYYGQTFYGIWALVTIASLVFLLLLAYQRWLMLRGQRTLEQLAYTDPLTGGRTYAKFLRDAERLTRQRPGEPHAFWSMDVRQFKRINDIIGYDNANQVLWEIAQALEETSNIDAIFGHTTADIFIGLRYYHREESLRSAFMDLIDRIQRSPTVMKHQLQANICIGAYSVHENGPLETIDDMINRANIAKQYAKEGPGNNLVFFDQAMADTIHRETELESAAPAALAAGEFVFYLQPKIDILNGQSVAGAEALCRWKHPRDGLISPGEFIPLFERNGFIVQLDGYIFEAACRWYRDVLMPTGRKMSISLNVSRRTFLQEDFLARYTAIKDRYGIPGQVIELELTESLITEGYGAFHDSVRALQAAGFICSIDDFGSGYSSLNALKNLPMDVIKLDAMFFMGSESVERERIIVENFVRMAKELRMVTVAEGVETREQVDFLQSIGNDLIQGYIFSRPLPVDEFLVYCDRVDFAGEA